MLKVDRRIREVAMLPVQAVFKRAADAPCLLPGYVVPLVYEAFPRSADSDHGGVDRHQMLNVSKSLSLLALRILLPKEHCKPQLRSSSAHQTSCNTLLRPMPPLLRPPSQPPFSLPQNRPQNRPRACAGATDRPSAPRRLPSLAPPSPGRPPPGRLGSLR